MRFTPWATINEQAPAMTFVTKLSFASGDHDVLAETVQDLKSTLERKGAECKVHTPRPPRPSAFHLQTAPRRRRVLAVELRRVQALDGDPRRGRHRPRSRRSRLPRLDPRRGRGRPEEAARTPSGLILKAARPRATQSSSPVATIRSPETNHPSSFARSAIFGWNTHATSPKIGIIDAPTIA